ncbi:flagellin [Inquilinus sp. CAU 1745]|uniref:flagellin N-terminal helical domain-containing protein n=1 Tax=Inquilinus sp. CAU 1745 TaxID=3140369 RepID=UPI00325B77CE
MPTVTTNTAANSALRFLNLNSAQSGSSVSKLASGSRIVKASDDAAGLAISTRLKADINVLKQASVNASQGASVLQVADGGLARVSDVLQRMKALAAQSLSGVPSDTERGFIDAEYQQLLQEIDGIAETSRFNGASLLDGSGDYGALDPAAIPTYDPVTGAAETTTNYGDGVDFFVGTVATDVININLTDPDIAKQSADALDMSATATSDAYVADGVLPTTSTLFTGTMPEVGLLRLGNFSAASFTGLVSREIGGATEYAALQLSETNVTNQVAARDAMNVVDDALNTVSQSRANVGAVVSRFDFRGQQIATATENIKAANSAISDVDLAAEQSKLVSSQVLVQAAVSALSQANQIPQNLLRLLQ